MASQIQYSIDRKSMEKASQCTWRVKIPNKLMELYRVSKYWLLSHWSVNVQGNLLECKDHLEDTPRLIQLIIAQLWWKIIDENMYWHLCQYIKLVIS